MIPAAVPLDASVGVTEPAPAAVGVVVVGDVVEAALNAIAVAGTKILQSISLPRRGWVNTRNIHFLPKYYSW